MWGNSPFDAREIRWVWTGFIWLRTENQWCAPVKMKTLRVLQEAVTLQNDKNLFRKDCSSVVKVQVKFLQKGPWIYASKVFRLAVVTMSLKSSYMFRCNVNFNPLNAELYSICHLLALLGAHHILHVSRIRVKHAAYLNTETKKKHTHSIHKQDIQCTNNRILSSFRVTIVAVDKQLTITYSERVSVVLVMQHAERIRRFTLLSVACPAHHVFPHYVINGMIFGGRGGEVTAYKMCVVIFYTIFIWNISHSKKKWARHCHKCTRVPMYSTGYSCQILIRSNFLDIFTK